MGGFKKWVCKIEGKEVPPSLVEPLAFVELPGNITSTRNLYTLISDVLLTGVGGVVEHENAYYRPVDLAFEWCTHEWEDEWSSFHSEPVVTQDIYDACVSWEYQCVELGL